MKIKITNKDSGLEVGKVYDLCDMSAKNLVDRRLAVVDKVEIKAEPKTTAPKRVKKNGLQSK